MTVQNPSLPGSGIAVRVLRDDGKTYIGAVVPVELYAAGFAANAIRNSAGISATEIARLGMIQATKSYTPARPPIIEGPGWAVFHGSMVTAAIARDDGVSYFSYTVDPGNYNASSVSSVLAAIPGLTASELARAKAIGGGATSVAAAIPYPAQTFTLPSGYDTDINPAFASATGGLVDSVPAAAGTSYGVTGTGAARATLETRNSFPTLKATGTQKMPFTTGFPASFTDTGYTLLMVVECAVIQNQVLFDVGQAAAASNRSRVNLFTLTNPVGYVHRKQNSTALKDSFVGVTDTTPNPAGQIMIIASLSGLGAARAYISQDGEVLSEFDQSGATPGTLQLDYGFDAASLFDRTSSGTSLPAGAGGNPVWLYRFVKYPRRLAGSAQEGELRQAILALAQQYKPEIVAASYTVTPATEAQTWEGIAFELASDSIQSDGGGIQNTNTFSVPLDLTPSERTRLATTIMSVNGNPMNNVRLATGLYYRGISADGKRFIERLPSQNAAMKVTLDQSGVGGLYVENWSPAPFYKTTAWNPPSDPTAYNTYVKNLLEGGTLATPNKTTDPTGYAAWIDDYAANSVATLEGLHQNVYRVTKYGLQNEPLVSAGYPSCTYSNQQYYDCLKAIVAKIDASAILATYNGVPNTVRIIVDSLGGTAGVGAALIRADSALLARVSYWAYHAIGSQDLDAQWIRTNKTTLLANAGGKPVVNDEAGEYFDPYVDPGQPATYRTPAWRFANTSLMISDSVNFLGSPLWWWIHIGKPTNGPQFERQGRALTAVRSPGMANAPELPAQDEGTFQTLDQNWNAVKPWIGHVPPGCKVVSAVESRGYAGRGMVVFKKPGGKLVVICTNRNEENINFTTSGLGTGTFAGTGYTATTRDVSLGTVIGATKVLPVSGFGISAWVEQ